ncbi:putative manganese-dependent inorganic diphosphatase [Alkalibacter rhizosphaerae]|uniref:inorganic diphosphatase n=1 Tax=Alkalibacter rhizosphaerae TaxID=2815577 RepID=A0A975AIT8_9FIRM|nr:putative manganese-dependent inorganic diphosphatase [Alkalibacter rhizosphaerae]QSX08875.1 putative manganese-dependent inorganic diphosphatase [Alkalibacter rhizosphaerae]
MNDLLVFGHRNPDTDTVTSAIAMADLKTRQGFPAKAAILDEISAEAKYVLDFFGVSIPQLLENVKIQMKDLNYDRPQALKRTNSIYDAYVYMGEGKLRTLPITDDKCQLLGIVTMKDIAMSLIQKNQRFLKTSVDNVLKNMEGVLLSKAAATVDGEVLVVSFHMDTIEEMDLFQKDSIVIVGDRLDIYKHAIEQKVQLVILTGGKHPDPAFLEAAEDSGINVIATDLDTYEATKMVFLTNYVENIIVRDNLLFFGEDDYLTDCREIMKETDHSKFPLLNRNGEYLGIIGRSHVISPQRKRVILVDHNEYSQSAEGIEEAEILEVIDHHRIGDISTSLPIVFRNMPVGSTNTILYYMYKEAGMEPKPSIAGLMLAGIISDTLFLKSPTTTEQDIEALEALHLLVMMDIDKFAMEMFKKGTDLSNKSVEEIFFADYKEFLLEGWKVGISQVFTLDMDSIQKSIDEFLTYIDNVNESRHQSLTLCIITDILKQGSYIFYNEGKLVDGVFGQKMSQGMFMEGWVSRKKQIVPTIHEGIKKYLNK